MTITYYLQQFQVALGIAEYGCIFDADFVEKTVAFLGIGHGVLLLLNEHNVILFRVMTITAIIRFFFFFFFTKYY